MAKPVDPYYNRKPVPDELIKDVGLTGLTPQEEFYNRERKYSATGVDVRRFSTSKKSGMEPLDDPYYGRKPVAAAEIVDVGITGLSPEQEYLNRERKYSATGVDVRRFSTSRTGGMEPLDDPYYSRKPVSAAQTVGIGETGLTAGEEYEQRERKLSLFQLSTDPFENVAGRHRQSISGVASSASTQATRRRSSAVAPDAAAAAAAHSGYSGGDKLAPIESKPELPPVDAGRGFDTDRQVASGSNTVGDQTRYHNATTAGHDIEDPDSVAPDERR